MAFRRRNKYNAVKVIIDGIKFASRLEGAIYLRLKGMLAAGHIHSFEMQSPVYFTPACKTKIDFKVYVMPEMFYYVEAKGKELYPYKTYKKQWPFMQKVRLEVYSGDYRNPKGPEVILPCLR